MLERKKERKKNIFEGYQSIYFTLETNLYRELN